MRNTPETSKEAYRSLEPAQLNDKYKKILKALAAINEGTTEEVAAYLKIDHEKIWKRFSELHRMELIYRPGNKRLMRSGKFGFTWMLRNPEKVEKTKPPELVYKKNEPTAADFASKIIQKTMF